MAALLYGSAELTNFNNEMDNKDLRIAQINAGRGAVVMHELRKLAEELQLDVLCIQEPYTRDGVVPGMPVTARQLLHGEHPMAAIIIFNRDVTVTNIRQYTDEHCVCAEIISGGCKLVVVNQYYQFADPVHAHLDKTRAILLAYRGRHILVMADLNAKSALWHSQRTDERGTEVEMMIAEMNIEVVNRPGPVPTYRGRAGVHSNIDATLATAGITGRIVDWVVEDGLSSSDHNLIHFKIRGDEDMQMPPDNVVRGYNLRKANWDLLKRTYREEPLIRRQRADDMAKALTSKIRRAMDAAIPRIRPAATGRSAIWTPHLSELRARMRRTRKLYQRALGEGERAARLEVYRESKNEYEQVLFQTKIRSWGTFVERCLETDAWGIPYKIAVEKIHPPVVLSTLRREDGGMTGDWQESADILLDTLLPLDDQQGETEGQRQDRLQMEEQYMENAVSLPLRMEEVVAAINKSKNKKAPGLDLIQSEVLRYLQDSIAEEVCMIANCCLETGRFPTVWKRAELKILKKGEDRDPELAGSYRPICLLNNLGKVMERLVCNRLREHREMKGLHPNQFGFRPRRSTEDAINFLIEKVWQSDARYVMTVFVDIAGAFDNLWWPALFRELREMQCPRDIYNVLRSYCSNRYVLMRCPERTIARRITKGCPQGSICGPIFWDIMMDGLLKTLDHENGVRTAVAYADDLAVVIEGNSRLELENKAAEVMVALDSWCKSNKMKVAAGKTHYALMKGALQRDPSLRLAGRVVGRKQVNRYLGVELDEKLNFQVHIETISARATKIMQTILSIASRQYRIPLSAIRLYMSMVMTSIAGYGSSVWAFRLRLVKPKTELRRAQRGVMVRVSGAFSTVSFDALALVLNMIPIDLEIRRRSACYWLRRGQQEKVREVLGVHAWTKKEVWEVILREWQEDWQESQKGERVRAFFPTIIGRRNAEHVEPTRGLVHFLTGHGPYPQNLYRFGRRQDDICDCGERGTPEHMVYACPLVEQDVQQLRRELETVDTGEILRNPDKTSLLCRLADRISQRELEKFRNQR